MSEDTLPVLEEFRLLMELNPEGETEAFVPVRWCLSAEARQALLNRKVTDAYMLIMVAANSGTANTPFWEVTDKKLVKLTAEMTYVRFNRPGMNRVYGLIVWPAYGGMSSLRKTVFQGYTDLSPFDGHVSDEYAHYTMSGSMRLDFVAELDVLVPREAFAPEPKPWRKELVRKFFRDREKDQCHFRRRFLVSLAWLPLYVVLTTFVRASYGIYAGFIGYRNVKWSALWHPQRDDTSDIWSSVRSGRYWWNIDKSGDVRPFYWILFQPLTYTFVTGMLWVLGSVIYYNNKPVLGWSLLHCFVFAVLAHVAMAVMFIVLIGIAALLEWLRSKIAPSSNKSRLEEAAARKEVEVRKEIDALAAELQAMVCTTSTRQPSLEALPEHKRTLVLRFNELKKEVCRPFAR